MIGYDLFHLLEFKVRSVCEILRDGQRFLVDFCHGAIEFRLGRNNRLSELGDLDNLGVSFLLCVLIFFLQFFKADFFEDVGRPGSAGLKDPEAGAAANNAVAE